MSISGARTRLWTLSTAVALWALAPQPLAQEVDPADEEGSRYAHVRLVEGKAHMVRAYDGETTPLDLNLPIVPGDRLEAEDGSRLEIRLADASVLRAGGALRLDVHSLASADSDEEPNRLELLQGDLSLEVVGGPRGAEPAFQVDTPSGTAYLMTSGLYRMRSLADGRTIVWVREGVAEVEGDGSTVIIRSGQSTQLAEGQGPSNPTTRLSRLDDFERWVEARRDDLGGAIAEQEVVEDLPEPVQPYAGDLSRYGRWESVEEYGRVWIPTGVGTGWYPYYNGYWVGSPIGHIWVSYEPWGWAPYHYGRWHWLPGYGWVWSPGAAFAGAWVAWWSGPTYVAWVPLGYYDRPAIDLHLVLSSGHRWPRGGWSCVSYPVFYSRDLPRRYVRDAAVLRAHLSHAVKVHRLPEFQARDLRHRPGLGAEVFSAARRSAESPKVRRFHPADRRAQWAGRSRGSGPAATHPGPGPGSLSRPVRVTTPQHRVDPYQPPPGRSRNVTRPPRPQAAVADPRRAAPQARALRPQGRQGERAARPDAAGPERSIREFLSRVSRPSPNPGAASREAASPPRRAPRAEPRGSAAPKSPAPRGSSSPKSRPKGSSKRH